MKKISYLLVLSALLFSCSAKTTKDEIPTQEFLKSEIKEINDSLQGLYKNLMEQPGYKFPTLAINEAIHRNLQYYKYYPKDAYAAECLDKVQQLYMQEKAYDLSLNYTDTILLKYPKYAKRASLLLNAGSTGEIMQDTTVIRKYYEQLLREYPKLEPGTKKMVEFRLKNLNLTFDQLVDLQIQEVSQRK